jgi:L-alanine-DL-glutamate epimerase-like enolase superfamily enzyme
MKITAVRSFIVHCPVTSGQIADATYSVTHWGAPGAIIETDAGITGYGYTGTHGHLATDRLIASTIDEVFAPVLVGEDPTDGRRLWNKMFLDPSSLWVGRAGIITLAIAALDVALWDLRSKHAEMPLWKFLGGATSDPLEAYNTDGGWLNFTQQQLVDDTKRFVEELGFKGVKIKVGKDDPSEDLRRIEAVRKAIGDGIRFMVDANGKLDLPRAIALGSRLKDYNIGWFEEPMWFDDLYGHVRLAETIETPIALGEQLYRLEHFRDFISAGAVTVVQPDALRLAGITEWLQVADLAAAHRLPVVAHVGDMAQIHQHVAISHPSTNLLEYIPWLREAMEYPVTVKDGYFVTPKAPGASTTLRKDALERFGKK